MRASDKAQELKRRAKALTERLWDVSGRRASVDWAADADGLLDDFIAFLERSDVRAALQTAQAGEGKP